MLIAQMVARNEANRYLAEVLSDLRSKVDKIVFTDDASDDDTPLIAKHAGAHVYHMPEPTFTVNEGALRQAAWNNLENHAREGDWILAIDADEKFFPNDRLDYWLSQTRFTVLGVTFYHMWNEKGYRMDKAWAPTVSQRLFRFRPNGLFRERRLACGSEPSYVMQDIRRGRFNPRTGLRMQHLGYARDEDKIAKFERYMQLDKGDFHSLQHIKSIMDEDPLIAEWIE